MKLSVKGFALAGGILWGAALFLWTLSFVLFDHAWGIDMLDFLVGFYPYYDFTVVGAFAGLIAGFVDGFVGCAAFAWLYNKLA